METLYIQMERRSNITRFCPALTLLEMVIAMAIMAIIFAVLVPQLRAIQNSWASKAGDAETLQNGRVLTDHLRRNLASAAEITVVSGPAETNGYIEFQDNDENSVRYDINGGTGYVEFGPVGNLADLAGPVSQFQITCYDACDLDTPLDPVIDTSLIRLVKVQTTLTNSAGMGRDLTLTASAYLRTDAIDLSPGEGTYHDEFNESSYSGNDGTLTWTGDWLEINESDGASRGDEVVTEDPLASPRPPTNQLRVRDNDGGGEGVMRQANLEGAVTATLSLLYRRAELVDAGDYVAVEVSTNGTDGPWTEIVRFEGPANEFAYQPFSQDISAYIDAHFAIRFISSPTLGGKEDVWFDEVEIQLSQ